MPLADHEITALCTGEEKMITPFEPALVRTKETTKTHKVLIPVSKGHNEEEQYEELIDEKVISYGLSSYGYDVRCSNKFKLFTDINSSVIDPKNFKEENFIDIEGDYCIIPPNSFALSNTIETFKMPKDVIAIVLGKSTYARCGLVVNCTPIEPGWKGQVTLEFSNTTRSPIKVYANEGVAQFLFFRGNECHTSYGDRNGKYQNQMGITLPST
jgi:dCTP deaminase